MMIMIERQLIRVRNNIR